MDFPQTIKIGEHIIIPEQYDLDIIQKRQPTQVTDKDSYFALATGCYLLEVLFEKLG